MKTILEFINKGHIKENKTFDLYKAISDYGSVYVYIAIKNLDDYEYLISVSNLRLRTKELETTYRTVFKGKVDAALLFRPRSNGTLIVLTESTTIQDLDNYGGIQNWKFKKLNEKISIKDITPEYWKKHNWRSD